jgi:hypothetical protein
MYMQMREILIMGFVYEVDLMIQQISSEFDFGNRQLFLAELRLMFLFSRRYTTCKRRVWH